MIGVSKTLRLAVVAAVALQALLVPGWAAAQPIMVDQGTHWTRLARDLFYSQNQGSQLIPLFWLAALKQPNGKPFLENSLIRYGYLPNPASPTPGLPVGFTVNTSLETSEPMVGMTCAACHTRQIEVAGKQYRIDGGPAIVDAQALFADLDSAVGAVLTDPMAFAAFAESVLGPFSTPTQRAKLEKDVAAWHLRYHTEMATALPAKPWGIGRIDAVGVIFDRLTGLDLGPAPSHLIPENIRPADAPVRYPFLWNAPVQDFTQWAGFAANGSDLLALERNLGEVFGVFATFAPQKSPTSPLGVDYLAVNSANFRGLEVLETLVRRLGPPKWPWAINGGLAAQGQEVFSRTTSQGGCIDCHGITPGITRHGLFREWDTWATPVLNVGTDTRQYQILDWTAKSGVLKGASIPLLSPTPLQPVDKSNNIVQKAVLGSIIDYALSFLPSIPQEVLSRDLAGGFPTEPATTGVYEARVLQGIWAAAPYLHNGSVPTLAELLKPSSERARTFAIGPRYDTTNVGLAAQQGSFSFTVETTGCDDLSSGNSNCGHEYGTWLSDDDKRALLEYLKAL